ncbi:hypothetical protein [Mesorhizobium sp. J428]|uniref:hypothetical protein n=1 Tax=Mesorhizobium sp. J428 TaxID=2898440 RepID=UPI002151F58C|nr:hypothetical protein [Mesorhizobium sp. J428]MCR5858916.1 hypothetical protein [Mesorhizobium sp. J428]
MPGDMLASVYDPTNVAADAFDRDNHYGPVIWPVSSRADIYALDTTAITTVNLTERGRVGLFVWTAGNFTSLVAADPMEGIYVPSSSVATSSGCWVRQRDTLVVKAEWCGVKADFNTTSRTGTDDTAAFLAAFNLANTVARGYLEVGPGVMAVTSVLLKTVSGVPSFITFKGTRIYGIATTAQDAIVILEDYRHFNIKDLDIVSDGGSASALFHHNYGCALQLRSVIANATPTQFGTIDGLLMSAIKNGLVIGNLYGQAAQAAIAQSEIFIRNARTIGVMRPFYMNALNSIVTTTGCVWLVQQSGSHSSWWVNADTWNVRCDEGSFQSIGDEFQNALTVGYMLYGKGMTLVQPQWECGNSSYLNGSCSISQNSGGFVAGLQGPLFVVAPGTTGTLSIDQAYFRRVTESQWLAGVAVASNVNLVEADEAPDFEIMLSNSKFREFRFDPNNAPTKAFVRGGRLSASNVILENHSSFASYRFKGGHGPIITGADVSGASMSATADLSTPKGGWALTGLTGGNFHRSTDSPPPGHTLYIAIESVGTAGSIATPGDTTDTRVKGGEDYILDWWCKKISGDGGLYIITSQLTAGGASLGITTTTWYKTGAQMVDESLDDWNRTRCPIKTDPRCAYLRIAVQVGATAIRSGLAGFVLH